MTFNRRLRELRERVGGVGRVREKILFLREADVRAE